MDELNEKGGQKCPKCGKPMMLLGNFAVVEPQSNDILYVRQWQGVDCATQYLEVLSVTKVGDLK